MVQSNIDIHTFIILYHIKTNHNTTDKAKVVERLQSKKNRFFHSHKVKLLCFITRSMIVMVFTTKPFGCLSCRSVERKENRLCMVEKFWTTFLDHNHYFQRHPMTISMTVYISFCGIFLNAFMLIWADELCKSWHMASMWIVMKLDVWKTFSKIGVDFWTHREIRIHLNAVTYNLWIILHYYICTIAVHQKIMVLSKQKWYTQTVVIEGRCDLIFHCFSLIFGVILDLDSHG